MFFYRLLFFFVGCFLWCSFANAQINPWENSNLRKENYTISDTLQLKAIAIIPENLEISEKDGSIMSPDLYKIDAAHGKIIFSPVLVGQEVEITYYIHPDLQKQIYLAKDSTMIQPDKKGNLLYEIEEAKTVKQKTDLFNGLESRGSLVRGIRFGNNQSASTQSSLDLQLNGNLSQDITVNAAISDNNVPIEADGYTQQLQEFDKVYVELANKNSKIRAGHIDLVQSNDFFGNFTLKATGLQVGTEIKSKNAVTKVQASGAMTRGEFRSVKFTGENGNQGPYKLSGNNSETYVIIISGSERVYIDGVLMTRGESNDYVINYNTGELTFTSNRQITANTRITTEYLYANNSYSQFLGYAGIERKSDRFYVAGHFYTNGDAKNNPTNGDLSNEDKEILSQAGNDTDLMYAPTGTETAYDSAKNLYRKVFDGLNNYYEYSTDPNETLYTVTFTLMGNNMGDYLQTNLDQNGKIYQYVAPINGVKQGNYEPVKLLSAPKRMQMYTFNAKYNFKTNGFIGFDAGISNKDQNLFSDKDDEDNMGMAGRIYGQHTWSHNNWKFTPNAEVSYLQKNFNAIQRLRTVEFARDFNLTTELESLNQLYLVGGLTANYKENLIFRYNASYLNNAQSYTGIKNQVIANYTTEKTSALASVSQLNTDASSEKSNYLKYQANYKRKLGKSFWLGADYSGEDNRLKPKDSVNLSENSFRWDEIKLLSGIGDSTKMSAEFTFYNRRDDSVRAEKMQRMMLSNGVIANTILINKINHKLQLNLHYRNVAYQYSGDGTENYLTGNVRWFKTFLRNGITINTYYELGSGVEPQREFEYVKVTDGLGIYKWTDYNGDGIQQLDEFEVAEFSDQANYLRVYTDTNVYIKTNKNAFTFSTRIKPKELLASSNTFWDRWLLSASLQTTNSLRKENKTIELNPFVNNSLLMGSTKNFRSNLVFNQGAKYKWMSSYTYTQSEIKSYVYTGSEYKNTKSHLLNLRYKVLDNLSLLSDVEKNNVWSDSDLFSSRRYEVNGWRFAPQISYQWGKQLNTSLTYTYQNKKNIQGEEKLNQDDFQLEIQWNDQSKSSMNASVNLINNMFNGTEQSVVGNQMMQGLKAGKNYVWQVVLQRQLSSFLNLNISYDGRKTEGTKSIHTGNIQIQARF